MDKERILEKIESVVANGRVMVDEPMKRHTTFKIGGPADLLVEPSSIEEVEDVLNICRSEDIPVTVIGNGSNLLVRDGGIRGVVVKIAELLSDVSVYEEKIVAEAGALMSKISSKALEHSLGGFEFASGIPGTIGGAVTMNAGAYGGEIKDYVSAVTCIDSEGQVKEYSGEEMAFGYRKSLVQAEGLVVLKVEISLNRGDRDEIKSKIDDYTERRTSKQPLHLPSGGSTFKRPEGYFAGKLIEDAGLRGLRHRNIQVSEKHCGFVVNLGESKAEDVLNLIGVVQKTVYDKFGIQLEPEIRIIGEEI
ncbi:UDP-N-acetylenolpyruvoylglucosamine reductase [Andreesenia angusta]|uniref:UDP-N-acetylenolpyruvoylglucosamine reductase n=1 Tax=Andreesenia angusta TaxID=39480 RepID=A0A1S1V7C1_9FIRM|nr:UDP-N-acetylmuramate dehydrogenase [Andreesenia angusta]OHW62057.1 UDP-N-acetylenolpyruvoylglucosamine reductase [Andreesenia angusta]